MNPPNQPTPRTNAAWAKTFESELNQFWSGNAANKMRDECAKLERELTETERLRFGADADRRQLRCELTAAKEECEELLSVNATGAERLRFVLEENSRLRAEVERLTTKIGNQADRIRYLEGATNHATGTPLSKAIARAEKAEAELAEAKVERETVAQSSLRSLEAYIDKLKQFAERAERAERAEADNAKWQKLLLMSRDDREIDLISEIEEQARLLGKSGEREADLLGKLGRLESELAAIKNGHGELGKYEQLRLKNAELQAALAFIAENGGTTHETECGTISCNGLWCAEQARAAIDAARKEQP
jgi:chromosome segregation ATPase